jgi:F-type H+-transporting ATPase subunit b
VPVDPGRPALHTHFDASKVTMRKLPLPLAGLLLVLNAAVAIAQEHGAEAPTNNPLSLRFNLMFWTLAIFGVLYFILHKWAFPPILGAVEKREKALEQALEQARKDREEASKLLEQQQQQIEGARTDAQKLIAEGRATAEKMRHDLLEETRREQQEMLERAKRELDTVKEKAIGQLRREAVELALAGASKVIEQNLDSAKNRQLVESYLGSLESVGTTSSRGRR